MKKLLVVFDGTSYSATLADFTLKIARESNSSVHAIFTNPSIAPIIQYPFPNDLPLASTELVTTEEMLKENQNIIDSNVEIFKETCTDNGVRYIVDPNNDFTLEELVDHSAFTDLIVCDTKGKLGNFSVEELLVDTHCPVLLASQNVTLPSKAILCYDESFSSILAIKMYSYLFPEWRELPTSILSINPKGDNGLKYDDYLDDWLPMHFPNLQKQLVQGNLQRELINFIRRNDDSSTVVVMGAFGRNAVSRMFHKSLANVVIEETNACIFIMHE